MRALNGQDFNLPLTSSYNDDGNDNNDDDWQRKPIFKQGICNVVGGGLPTYHAFEGRIRHVEEFVHYPAGLKPQTLCTESHYLPLGPS
jgi:hypothetical protein